MQEPGGCCRVAWGGPTERGVTPATPSSVSGAPVARHAILNWADRGLRCCDTHSKRRRCTNSPCNGSAKRRTASAAEPQKPRWELRGYCCKAAGAPSKPQLERPRR
eukprot:4961671-Alexandrium_andersonii.AAC.1